MNLTLRVGGVAAITLFVAASGFADTTTVSGTFTGAPASPAVYLNGPGVYEGAGGGVGYSAADPATTYVFTAQVIGGAGGTLVGTNAKNTYIGGGGGSGVELSGTFQALGRVTATFNGGTYTGGAGGGGSGLGNFIGQFGGPGVSTRAADVTVTGGTFVGGASGVPVATSAVVQQRANGFEAGPGSSVSIQGGSFTAGSLAALPGQFVAGFGSGGLEAQNGTATIYGGRFFAGTGNPAAAGVYSDSGGVINIVGTGFTINGLAVGYGTVSQTTGLLAGVLQNDGVSSSFTFGRQSDGVINLVAPVPEPTAIGLLTSGLLALGHRRRRA